MRFRRGFTLLEVLITIGVIVLLVAIVVPAINSAYQQAQAVRCQGNLRALWQGWTAFAADHDNHLPGSHWDNGNVDPDKRDWLFGQYLGGAADLQFAPQSGTIFKYMGHNYETYRCPSLEVAHGAYGGSNGRFDYTAHPCFTGCKMERLPLTAKLDDGAGNITFAPAPVIVEEDPFRVNGTNQDCAHSNNDSMSHTHRGGSFYAASDGSVQWFVEPSTCVANNWWILSIRGNWRSMGSRNISWGWWEQQ